MFRRKRRAPAVEVGDTITVEGERLLVVGMSATRMFAGPTRVTIDATTDLEHGKIEKEF